MTKNVIKDRGAMVKTFSIQNSMTIFRPGNGGVLTDNLLLQQISFRPWL